MTIRSTMRLWLYELEALPEYSCTLPTGVCSYKTWKRWAPYYTDRWSAEGSWLIGQYVPMHGKMWTYFHQVELYQGPFPEKLPPLRFKIDCSKDWLERNDPKRWTFPDHGGPA